ncbi:MAG TPA: hypothetical protein VFJ98_06780 [Mycobacteriales bacterium]|nr:hypothetical protein [Mycobacteriales bacterium]
MTDVDDRLRAELHQLANGITMPSSLPTGPEYRAAARARRTPTLAIAAAVAVVATVGALLVTIGRGATGVPPAEGGPAAWPTRGPLAGNARLIEAAVRTWAAAPLPASEQPPRDVHALYAGKSVAGKTVVLTGIDARGFRRIVWLNTDPTSTTPFRHRLHLVSDVLAPTGDDAGLVGLQAWRPTPRSTRDHVVIAIAPPSAEALQWTDQFRSWAPLPSRDGAGLEVVPTDNGLQDVSVRVGTQGHGTSVLGNIPRQIVEPTVIDHEPDPEPVDNSGQVVCHNGVCSASVGGATTTLGETGGTDSGWNDLRSSYMRQEAGTGEARGGWPEFAEEARLMATSLLQNVSSWSGRAAWSRLLTDNTGLYLYNWLPTGSPTQLVLYVDRPEWYGGRLGAYAEASGRVAGLAAVTPSRTGRQLIVVVADHLRVSWRSGSGEWRPMTVRHNVAVADVTGTDPSTIRYRVTETTGTVVQQGKPTTSAL